jgi:SAM-dependent methyltransferase
MRELNRIHYTSLFDKYGEDIRTLWKSPQSQQVRFSVLSRIGDLAGASILDVGCGFGDFLGFLKDRGIEVRDYLGIDCVDGILAVARKRHPSVRFENWDLFQLDPCNQFDWVFGSGLFNLKGPDSDEYALQMTRKMFSLAGNGAAANFLSSFTKRPDGFSNYWDPAHILELLAQGVSPILQLVHSYRSNDFTVFLYHEHSEGGRQ